MFRPNETAIPAIIGEWYKDFNGGLFEVVAIDEEDGTVEIQHFDGTIEEVDIDVWDEVAMTQVEPPEDWSGSMDMAREDFGPEFEDFLYEDWQNPLDMMDRL